ncbi:hypothetical protein EVAR_67162_1 [Eumeta japonica]|uniref:Uncharacterized protein n=1 Tax=Eumeta variegata TaxID=151549 RepID=A0A4C1ZR43_EUMVA|nr:hypothetical protein EVAR_67162_1 [Eumeta japonica]
MKQRDLDVFGLVGIVAECTLTMIGFLGLIMELKVWKLHHQTLNVIHGQNIFQGNSNKTKYGRIFLYDILVPVTTVWLHHQILKANYGQNALKKSVNPKYG